MQAPRPSNSKESHDFPCCFPGHPTCPPCTHKQKSLLLVNSGSPAPLRGCIDVDTGECVCVCFDFCPEPPQILRARFQLDTQFWGRQPVIMAFILWEGKLVLSISPGGGGGRGGCRGMAVLFCLPIWGPLLRPWPLSLQVAPGCVSSLESTVELLEPVPKSPTYGGNHNDLPSPASIDNSIPRWSCSSNACAQSRHSEHWLGLLQIKWDFVCID